MNPEDGIIEGIKTAVKRIPLWMKVAILVPIILILFVFIYAVAFEELNLQAVVCMWKSCDASTASAAPVKNQQTTQKGSLVKQEMQKKFESTLANGTTKGTVEQVAASNAPYQRPTFQAITDYEFRTMAQKMKDARIAQNAVVSEPAEEYGTITYSDSGQSSSSDGSAPGNLTGNGNAQKIWNYLTQQGFTPIGAAGIMGNMMQESSLNPAEAGGGLCQWIGSRWTALVAYASKNNLDPNSLNAQLGYLMTELKSGGYIDINMLNSESSAGNAAQYFELHFERAGKPMMQNRINYANQFYQQFANSSSTSNATTNQSSNVTQTNGGTNQAGNTTPVNNPAQSGDGDKIVQEAYNIYNAHGIHSSDPWIYSQPLRYQNGYSDCSWFAHTVYKNALGIDIGSFTGAQITQNAQYLHLGSDQLSNLMPGDLMYFSSAGGGGHIADVNGVAVSVDHVGIYIGDNKFMDMSTYTSDLGYNGGKGGISIKDFSQGAKFYNSTHKTFIGFIRIGTPGTGGGVVGGDGQSYDEAEVHIRALANTDWFGIKGSDIYKMNSKGEIQYDSNKNPILDDRFKGTMMEKTYLITNELKKQGQLYVYAGKARTDKWSEDDWMMNTRFLAYNCYLLGDKYVAKEGESGFSEWIGSLFSDGACTTLDNAMNTAGISGHYIDPSDWGVLSTDPLPNGGIYTKTEYSYICNPPPPPPPPSDTNNGSSSGSGSSNSGSGSSSGSGSNGVHPGPGGPLSAKGQKGTVELTGGHQNIEVGKNQYNCPYGVQSEIPTVTKYPQFPSNYSGPTEDSVLKNFEKYSLIIPNKDVPSDDSYLQELQYVLLMFYGDSLNTNDNSMLITIGGGEPFIVPMLSGTYNLTQKFNPPTNSGDNLDVGGVSGVPVFSTANGTVVSVGPVDGFGNTVMVKHDNGYYSFYAHMKSDYIVVKNGQVVKQGQLIGGVDSDGVADSTRQLHFEICKNTTTAASGNMVCSQSVDPEKPEPNLKFASGTNDSDKYANMFLSQWKEKAKTGTVFMMPGFSAATGVLSMENENPEGGCVDNAGDPGGISCGYYQFANSSGSICNFVNWLNTESYSSYFNYLGSYCPGESSHVPMEFMGVWGKLKQGSSYPADFKNAQLLFARKQFYGYGASQLLNNFNLDVNQRQVAVQEMVWSITVQQYSQINFLFRTAGFSASTDWSKVSDRDIITKVYDARIATVDTCFSSSSQQIKDSVRNRFIREKQEALALLTN